MIEVTNEMLEAVDRALRSSGTDRDAVAAVLAIVERDLVAEVERLRREVERLTVAAYPYSCLGCGNRFTKAAAAAGCDEDHRSHAARAKRGTGSYPSQVEGGDS